MMPTVPNLASRGSLLIALVAGVLLGSTAGCKNANPAGAVADLLQGFGPEDPSELARDAFDVYDADKRRRAVNKLSTASYGGEAPYLRAYRLLLDDPDPTVRAAAVSALGRHGRLSDVPRITGVLLGDEAKIARWEAARGLQRLHDARAIDPLIEAATEDPDMDVRLASVVALGQYPRRRVFNALVAALNDEDFGVAKAAERSLQTLTGKALGDRSEQWWQWAKGADDLFRDQETYYFPVYRKPPGLIGRVAFWTEQPDAMKRPRTPEQGEAPGSGDGGDAPLPSYPSAAEAPEDPEPTTPPTETAPTRPDETAEGAPTPETTDPASGTGGDGTAAAPSSPGSGEAEASDEPRDAADETAPDDPREAPADPRPSPNHPLGASG